MYFVYVFKDPDFKACGRVETRKASAADGTKYPEAALSGIRVSMIFSKRYAPRGEKICLLEIPFYPVESQQLWPLMQNFQWPKKNAMDAAATQKLTVMYRVLRHIDSTANHADKKIADIVFAADKLIEAKAYQNRFLMTESALWGQRFSDATAQSYLNRQVDRRGIFLLGDTVRDTYAQFSMGTNCASTHSKLFADAITTHQGNGGKQIATEYSTAIDFEIDMVKEIQKDVNGKYYNGKVVLEEDWKYVDSTLIPPKTARCVGAIIPDKITFVWDGVGAKCQLRLIY
jgi:hypothetical protein